MSRLDQSIRRFNEQMTNTLPDGYILQGTVVKRYLKRRVSGVSKKYGPHYL